MSNKETSNHLILESKLNAKSVPSTTNVSSIVPDSSPVKDGEISQLANEMSSLDLDSSLTVCERNVLKALLAKLPLYVNTKLQSMQQEISAHTDTLKTYGEHIKKLQGHVNQLDKQQKSATSKISGYKQQVNGSTEKMRNFQNQINAINLDFAKYNKENNIRANEFSKLQHRVKADLDEVKKAKSNFNKQLKEFQLIDVKKFKEMEKSQVFISEKYEEVNKNVKTMSEDLAITKSKSEHNAAYSRFNNVEMAGIPVQPNEKDEDAKTIVENICKELHYSIRKGTISTAHRLKAPRSGGPPAIIIRFNNRDVRNDVYKLKSQLKDKTEWRCYDIRKLYINESLTPNARSLLYKTKNKLRELYPNKNKRCFVWTYKGCVFCRKDEENAPRISVDSENTLNDIASGKISLSYVAPPSPTTDAPLTFPNDIALNSTN